MIDKINFSELDTEEKFKTWLEEQILEAMPMDRPPSIVNPRYVAEAAAKRLGYFGYGSSELLNNAGKADTYELCAGVLADCLAAMPAEA